MTRNDPKQRQQSGFSLIGVLVAVAIIGIISAALATLMVNNSRSVRRIELKGDVLAARRMLDERISCGATFDPAISRSNNTPDPGLATCRKTSGRTATVFDRDGNVLISSDPKAITMVGAFTLRAVCDLANKGLRIEAARPKPGLKNALYAKKTTNFFDEPLFNQPLDWASASESNGRLVYPLAALPCSEKFGPSPTTGITPKKLCQVVRETFTRGASPYSNDDVICPPAKGFLCGWRSKAVQCPTRYPVAMGVSTVPSGYASGYQQSFNYDASDVPTGGRCSVIFLLDSPLPSRGAFYAKLTASGQVGANTATCQVTCCDF